MFLKILRFIFTRILICFFAWQMISALRDGDQVRMFFFAFYLGIFLVGELS